MQRLFVFYYFNKTIYRKSGKTKIISYHTPTKDGLVF